MTTPNLTIPIWTRSTDIRDLLECQMKWLLRRLYAPDFLPTWNPLGTGIHRGIYEALVGGKVLEDAIEIAADLINDALAAGVNAGLLIQGTKRRTEATIFADSERMLRKWWQAVMEAEVEVYKSLDILGAVGELKVTVPAGTNGSMAPLSTTIDAIIPLEDTTDVACALIDWKSGATAKANPLQLYTYLYAARHDPASPLYGVAPERVELWFHHLDFGKIQRAENYPGDDYIRNLLRWTEATKRSMRDTGFAPAHADWYCDYCTVRSHCPAWSGDLHSIARDARMTTLDFVPEPEVGDGHEE